VSAILKLILQKTWFHDASIDLRAAVHIIICFVAGLGHNQAVVEVKFYKKIITNWYGYLPEVQEIIMPQSRQIGGAYTRKW